MSKYVNYRDLLLKALNDADVGQYTKDIDDMVLIDCVDVYCMAIKVGAKGRELVTISSIIYTDSSKEDFDFLWKDLLNQLDKDIWMVESDFNIYLKCDTLLQLKPVLFTKSGGVRFNFKYQDFSRGEMKLPIHLLDKHYGVCRGQRIYTKDYPKLKQVMQP